MLTHSITHNWGYLFSLPCMGVLWAVQRRKEALQAFCLWDTFALLCTHLVLRWVGHPPWHRERKLCRPSVYRTLLRYLSDTLSYCVSTSFRINSRPAQRGLFVTSVGGTPTTAQKSCCLSDTFELLVYPHLSLLNSRPAKRGLFVISVGGILTAAQKACCLSGTFALFVYPHLSVSNSRPAKRGLVVTSVGGTPTMAQATQIQRSH